jgi:hypothetical protein
VSNDLEVSLAPERLDEGAQEERATFGLIVIRTAHASLTEGFDFYLNGYRAGPLASGYHLAEWLTWNWWRLRWEPRSDAADWALAHAMTSIGEGYVWPNIEIWSDGVRTAIISKPSLRPDAKPFRYIGGPPTIVPSTVFEGALDAFIPRIVGRLRDEGVSDTNLDRVWRDVLGEREAPALAKRRRLEALMGRDPDSVDDDAVDVLVRDEGRLGETAIVEVAAERAQTLRKEHGLLTATAFDRMAETSGFDSSVRDAVRLGSEVMLGRTADVPAWKLGAAAAQAIRQQERFGAAPISDSQLARMAGVGQDVLAREPRRSASLSFTLDERTGPGSKVVLRSKWEAGRRFDLARLIGDRLLNPAGALHPATRAYTYRQKAQRAFAAELLSPFEAVDDMLGGDYSPENQQDVADNFRVSPLTVNTLLKNHGRIERADDDEEYSMMAA